ncbi:MAG: acetophenone carboxylase [Gammaproteobacteria bacterium]|nr:acetophenone carboxylase [Gammaproteobacteria bacterium]|tara:strand:+ start:26 stop:373 length:348 start_codon:yes stop_codon:yes gene_type:complete
MTDEASKKVQVAEYLDIDLMTEKWHCNRCGHKLGDAANNYKEGCLIRDRNPEEIHQPIIEGEYTFAPDPEWCRIVECYCPNCGVLIDTEYLPPGHPLTHDIDIDIEALKAKNELE